MGLGENCIRNLVRVDGFPALKNGRKYMIHRQAADKWLEEQAKGTCGHRAAV